MTKKYSVAVFGYRRVGNRAQSRVFIHERPVSSHRKSSDKLMKSSPNLDALNYSLNCLQSRKCLAGSSLQRDHQISQISPIFHQLSKFHQVFSRFTFCLQFHRRKRINITKKLNHVSFDEISRCKTFLQLVSPGFHQVLEILPSFHQVFTRSWKFHQVFSKSSPGFTSPSFEEAAGFQRNLCSLSCDCEKRKKRFICSPESTKRLFGTKYCWIPGRSVSIWIIF